jgi:hypothetical protein
MSYSIRPTSRSFRLMWNLVCDTFPHEQEFTYQFHLKPIAAKAMPEYSPKTRLLAWDRVRAHAISTGQMYQISKSAYAWCPPVE